MRGAAESLAGTPVVEAAQRDSVQASLLSWFAASGRDLPWRRSRDPYAILISEVMLQQTQVERVIPKWREWLDRFPFLQALADAPRGDVIRAWQGLGYNLRAVRLHGIAQQCCSDHGGRLPDAWEELISLKGIGRYTAGAVACFALGQRVAVVDTNVRRVLGRVFRGEPQVERGGDRADLALANAVLATDAWSWNQALMDLGSTVCSVQRPACLVCPLRSQCLAAPLMAGWPAERRRLLRERRADYRAQPQRSSAARRVLRGRVVNRLRSLALGEWYDLSELQHELATDLEGTDLNSSLPPLLVRLAADGLLVLDQGEGGTRMRLPG